MDSSTSNSNRAILFGGQGTEVGKTIRALVSGPRADEVKSFFARASAVLGYDLLDCCLNDPGCLQTTAVSEPAILVATLARVAVSDLGHKDTGSLPTHAAGFGLGEYAALVYAKSLRFEDAVRLVKLRAEAMQEAAEVQAGGMVRVMGLDDAQLSIFCSDAAKALGDGSTLHIANHLFPKGRVLSGGIALVDWTIAHACEPKYGAIAVTKLPVAGAFHSPYMALAKPALVDALAAVVLYLPEIPVFSNVTARPYGSTDEIMDLLAHQIEAPVRWEQTIKAMLHCDVATFVDTSPGAQLKSIMRRIDKTLIPSTTSISDADVAPFEAARPLSSHLAVSDPSSSSREVAVVGISCRMPGGIEGPRAFWEAIRTGTQLTGGVPLTRWDMDALSSSTWLNKDEAMRMSNGAFIEGMDMFDNSAFHISPIEATSVEPRHRLLLEYSALAFADAGYTRKDLDGKMPACSSALVARGRQRETMFQSYQ